MLLFFGYLFLRRNFVHVKYKKNHSVRGYVINHVARRRRRRLCFLFWYSFNGLFFLANCCRSVHFGRAHMTTKSEIRKKKITCDILDFFLVALTRWVLNFTSFVCAKNLSIVIFRVPTTHSCGENRRLKVQLMCIKRKASCMRCAQSVGVRTARQEKGIGLMCDCTQTHTHTLIRTQVQTDREQGMRCTRFHNVTLRYKIETFFNKGSFHRARTILNWFFIAQTTSVCNAWCCNSQ